LRSIPDKCAVARECGKDASGLPPAVEALLIQCVWLAVLAGALHLLWLYADLRMSQGAVVALQGIGAAILSYWRRLPWWWLPIQAAFPAALALAGTLRWPPEIFLAGFVMLLAMYWSTFRTRVPFYPSGPAAWRAIASVLPQDVPVRLIDIGSGLGGAALYLARCRPDCDISGIELAPLPWAVSFLRARLAANRPRFLRGDYMNVDLASYDVVFAYLSTAAMPALWVKAIGEMRPGTLLLSHEFSIPGVAPHITCEMPDGRSLYGWRL